MSNEPSIPDLVNLQARLEDKETHLVFFGFERFVIAHTDSERESHENLEECPVHMFVDWKGPQGKLGYYWARPVEGGWDFEPVDSQKFLRATFSMTNAPGCDAEIPSLYFSMGKDGAPYIVCRCMVCGRCGRHTGNSHQGHYWSACTVTGSIREPHFCCPGDCELEAA